MLLTLATHAAEPGRPGRVLASPGPATELGTSGPPKPLSRTKRASTAGFRGGGSTPRFCAWTTTCSRAAASQPALIYDSPVTNTLRTYTYAELLDLTARFAGGLRDLGVGLGDRVIIYMPNLPEAVVAMLACARIGAVHSVVFGGFAPHELAVRIDDAQPRAIVCASGGHRV